MYTIPMVSYDTIVKIIKESSQIAARRVVIRHIEKELSKK